MKGLLKFETRLITDKILIRRGYIAFFFTICLLLVSCSKTEQNPLLGAWHSVNSLDSTTLTLSIAHGQQKFAGRYLFAENIAGKWQTKGNQLWLQYTPSFSLTADSLVYYQTNTGNAGITVFDSSKHAVTIQNGDVAITYKSLAFDYTLTEGQLVLKGQDLNLSLQQKAPPIQSVSFASIFRGILGLFFLIVVAYLLSNNRSKINWKLVGKGLLLQIVIALAVLKVPLIERFFDLISRIFVKVISFTSDGVNFLFAKMGASQLQGPLINFAFTILPTIIFFSALVSLFYYYGVIQKIVYGFAWLMKKLMHLSGAESLAAAGNVFLGQTEAPLLVKPYLSKMTKSEVMCLMTGGMATIAGGVLAAYVGFLGGDDPVEQAFFAKHLLTASIISAPAAIIAAKILVPETEKINTDLKVDKTNLGSNALEALSSGTTDGLKLAINVGAMLLVFISIMALGNYILGYTGRLTGINEWIGANTPYSALSFEFILGYAGRPIVWLMGVSWAESIYVGELLGTKTVLNEFVGYMRLGEMKSDNLLSEKATIISTYILCGFANFSSIGIQIGGIGALAPNRKGLLSKLGVKALIGGTMACLMTAAIVGMMY